MSAPTWHITAALVVGFVTLFAGCGGNGAPGNGTVRTDGNGIRIVLSDTMRFDPATITVQAGREVVLYLRNAGQLTHNFSIDRANVNQNVAPGAEATVVFTAPADPGQFEFYCGVPGHRGAGMVGALVVEE